MARSTRRLRSPVVCGTDFTQQAAQAANVAAGIAAASGRPLLLVHVAAAPGKGAGRRSDAAARDALRREAARLRAAGATVAAELHRGHADEVLTQRAEASGAALLVIGALGTRVPTRRFLGSIAERTAETAGVPTLVVRNDAPFEQWLAGKRPLRVFVGFDFTVTADAAVDWVRELMAAGRCDVTIGHLNPASDERRFGLLDRHSAGGNSPRLQELLERHVADRMAVFGAEPVDIRVQAAWGRVDLGLVALAADAQADLVVVGTHHRQGLLRLWSGSVSRGVLTEAPTSVVVVPVPTGRQRLVPIPAIRRVLVATDLLPYSDRAVAYACGIAHPDGVVRIVHVVHPRAVSGGRYERALGRSTEHARHVRALGRRLEALRPPDAQSRGLQAEATVVESEDPVTGICQEAERFDADVVVMGTKGTGMTSAVLGSVAEGVLGRSPRPVLVVTPARG